jgi:uncharacterized protein (DUF2062 family)
MFDRRNKLRFSSKVYRVFWPPSGFKRASKYLLQRLTRLPGTPYTLASGFAFGAAASCTPFVGLHLILAAFLAWLSRASILASVIGTSVGNPWTFPFIWIWIYSMGNWMAFGSSGVNITELDLQYILGHLYEAFRSGELSRVVDIAGPVLWPMFLGSIPTALCVWVFFYFPLNRIVKNYQQKRGSRRIVKKINL